MIAGVLFFLLLFVLSWFFRPLQFVQIPFVRVATWVSNQFSYLTPIGAQEYRQVVNERNAFAVDRNEFDTLKEQNAILRKELGFLKQRQFKGTVANILGRTVSAQTSTFSIDFGEVDGAMVGQAVIVDDGLFVGKITKTDRLQSIVTASTDFHVATGVTLFNATRTIGVAVGSTGNLIALRFIPIDEKIAVNDLVVTSGLEDHMPAGLLVGTVNAVKPDPEAPFQNAIVEPLIDIRTRDHVIVLHRENL